MTLTREDVAGLRAGQKVKAAVFEVPGSGQFTVIDTVLRANGPGLFCGNQYVRYADGDPGMYLVFIEVEPDPQPVFQRGDLVEAATTDDPDDRRILMADGDGCFGDGTPHAYLYSYLIDPVRMKAVPLDGEDHSEPRDGDVWEVSGPPGYLRSYCDRRDGDWYWADGEHRVAEATPVRYIGRWDA